MSVLFISYLDRFLGPELFVAAILLYSAYRIRTVKQIAGGVVATVGTLGTIGAAVLVSYGAALALGWVDVYPAEILADLTAGAQTAWEHGGNWLVERAAEAI